MSRTIDQQLNQLIDALRDVNVRQLPAAHSSAMNKSVAKIKTRTVRGVSRETRVPQKFIRKRFAVSRSRPVRPKSKMIAYVQGVSVADFVRNPAPGKKVRFAGQTKPAMTGSAFYNHAKSGKLLALQRKGKARYPIETIKVDIESPVNRILGVVSERVMRQEFPVLLRRDLIFRINKYAKF